METEATPPETAMPPAHRREPELAPEEILRLTTLREVFGAFCHELRQPLHVINMAAQVIQLKTDRLPLADEDKALISQRLNIILGQVKRAADLIQDARKLIHEAGDAESTEGSVTVRALIEHVRHMMEQQFRGRDIEVTWDTEEGGAFVCKDSRLAEAALVQALAFARDKLETCAGPQKNGDVSGFRKLSVKMMDQPDGALINILWPGATCNVEPNNVFETHPGLAHAAMLLAKGGGAIHPTPDGIVVLFRG
jgi:nitrogen fixation/metabolism regulation signal transduction histidine kinase